MKHHKFIYEERCIWLYEYSLYWELPYLTLSILKGVFEQMKIQKKKKVGKTNYLKKMKFGKFPSYMSSIYFISNI